jgi:hypothetical protein
VCFGFRVESSCAFRFLRAGDGAPLAVAAPSASGARPEDRLIFEWLPPNWPFDARLYAGGGRFRFWVDGGGWFEIDPAAGVIAVPDPANPVRQEERLWGIPAALAFSHRGDVPLHAAAVEVRGGAVLLAAPGHGGKTTLAAGFMRAGYRLLTEDLSCVRPGPQAAVLPGPALLRLRGDVYRRLEIPSVTAVGQTGDRVSLAIDDGRRGDGSPVPLRGVVLLRGAADRVEIERVDPAQAIRDLWALNFRLPLETERARSFAALAALAARTPLWNLRRPLRLDALDGVVARIADAAGEEAARV